ncbi:uncharacterized protein LOC122503454 [Leptopilina heterotoma]|uniref:uncharacterized protein LOC122503454 n=1 Tax=Leptopilina heterotoma TaxID=63436 RepID=UPI001CAA374F|nr:uncharacterized protein LOC122503454 [Leptopilina heterotoma]XP_043469939.1 uncharacterized protein LOC122503454 [Leptopilina heterotoma]XP_043469940.1 uncharacterized protein LOC122503454 [Leptopilina heterotoma]XP_043469941.1 uncharacterized protein LOC122503454 [Leptopilina heterotoma]XP_043469942.1 uncharacterized protein LOC122503454 [Leptopilina heterotoma]XP_043469944.1 uncharacterized protein LOC122503454 [Leptopilina heterotoma]XP_043469945.1 uncharacterized protein LOC122503454 [
MKFILFLTLATICLTLSISKKEKRNGHITVFHVTDETASLKLTRPHLTKEGIGETFTIRAVDLDYPTLKDICAICSYNSLTLDRQLLTLNTFDDNVEICKYSEFSKYIKQDYQVCTFSKLTPGHSYKFIAKRKGEFPIRQAIKSRNCTTDKVYGKPNPPLGPVKVRYHSDTAVKIDWTRPLNSPKNLRYQIIALAENDDSDKNCRNNTRFLTRFIVTDDAHYFFSGLTPGETYRFKISAFNKMGSSSGILSDSITMIHPLYYTSSEFTEDGSFKILKYNYNEDRNEMLHFACICPSNNLD